MDRRRDACVVGELREIRAAPVTEWKAIVSRRLDRLLDDPRLLFGCVRRRASRAGRVVQSHVAVLAKPTPPLADDVLGEADDDSDIALCHAVSDQQDRARELFSTLARDT